MNEVTFRSSNCVTANLYGYEVIAVKISNIWRVTLIKDNLCNDIYTDYSDDELISGIIKDIRMIEFSKNNYFSK